MVTGFSNSPGVAVDTETGGSTVLRVALDIFADMSIVH